MEEEDRFWLICGKNGSGKTQRLQELVADIVKEEQYAANISLIPLSSEGIEDYIARRIEWEDMETDVDEFTFGSPYVFFQNIKPKLIRRKTLLDQLKILNKQWDDLGIKESSKAWLEKFHFNQVAFKYGSSEGEWAGKCPLCNSDMTEALMEESVREYILENYKDYEMVLEKEKLNKEYSILIKDLKNTFDYFSDQINLKYKMCLEAFIKDFRNNLNEFLDSNNIDLKLNKKLEFDKPPSSWQAAFIKTYMSIKFSSAQVLYYDDIGLDADKLKQIMKIIQLENPNKDLLFCTLIRPKGRMINGWNIEVIK